MSCVAGGKVDIPEWFVREEVTANSHTYVVTLYVRRSPYVLRVDRTRVPDAVLLLLPLLEYVYVLLPGVECKF